MGYTPLQHYLQKFASLTPPHESVRRAVRDALYAVCGFTVPIEHIRFERGVIRLTLSPLERSEVVLHKSAILQHIRRAVPGALVRDIA